VRQALNYAVDKAAIVKNVLFGAADPMDAPMASTLFGYCRTGAYAHDPTRAKTLLAQAGITPGTRLQLLHPTGRYVQDKEAAQAIAGYLREVGLVVELQTMDWPSYVATISTRPSGTPPSSIFSAGRPLPRRLPAGPPVLSTYALRAASRRASTRTRRWTG